MTRWDPGTHGAPPTPDWALIEKLLACPLLRVIYLFGPPGVGKTYCAYHKGRIGAGVFPITLTPETPASELMGHYQPRGAELVWRDGPFVMAMRKGARLVLNEISHASADVLAILYPVLESEQTAELTLPTGEVLRPTPGFHCVLTDNEPPDDLPAALQDRFDCQVHIGSPHPEAMARLSPLLRRAAQRCFSLEPERRISLRKWLVIDQLLAQMDLAEACVAVLGHARGVQAFEAIKLAESTRKKGPRGKKERT